MPQTLPTVPKIFATNFSLQRLQAFNPVRGGGHQAVDLGEPLWQAEIETTALSREQGGRYLALFAKLRGTIRSIYIGDRTRRRPLAYADVADVEGGRIGVTSRRIGSSTRRIAASAAPWGAPNVTAVDRENGQITVTGFDAGAEITAGDYGHWDDGVTRRLHIIVEDAVANGAGVATLTVEPPPPSSSSSLPAPFTMQDPCAEMIVASAQAPFSTGRGHKATIRAAQILRTVAE